MYLNKLKNQLPFIGITLVIFFFSLDEGFFWDNITFGYRMGTFLHENGLFNFNFPDSFDPGHPPFLAFILATGWSVFGKSIWVSHLVLLPFTYGVIVQLYLFSKKFLTTKKQTIFAFTILLLDPTLSAQLVLINPEVIQIFFFLLAINSLHNKNIILQTIALFFLGIVSYRGMMLFAGLFLYDIVRHMYILKNSFSSFLSKKNITLYTISVLPSISFIIYRLLTKGWLQTHPNSPWSDCWHIVSFSEFIKNNIILAHRYLDFGRIGILIILLFLFFQTKHKQLSTKNKELLLLSISSVLFIIVISLLAVNPFGHRYFIVSYLCIALFTVRNIFNNCKKNKSILLIFITTSLVLGNLWVYPKHTAQGWDASLAHMPYFNLRKKAIQYMDNNKINIKNTSTFFPNHGNVDMVNLSGDMRDFQAFNGTEPYVFYSNVYNLSDHQFNILDQEYHILKKFYSYPIEIILYKHK